MHVPPSPDAVSLPTCSGSAPPQQQGARRPVAGTEPAGAAPSRAERVVPLHGERDIDAPLLAVAAVVADYPKTCEWVADCCRSELITVGRETLLYHRTRIGRGFDDRDVVLVPTLAAIDTPMGRGIRASSVSRPSPEVAVPPGCIRMPELTSEMVLLPLDAGRTRVCCRVMAQPGGWIPDWIVPIVSRTLPRRTLGALAQRVAAQDDPAAAQRLAERLGW